MSETNSAEAFTLELPEDGEVGTRDAMSNAWKIAGTVYKLAQSKLSELVVTKLPPKEDVLKAAEDAYDKYVKIIEDIGRDGFVSSVGALYDGLMGVVKS